MTTLLRRSRLSRVFVLVCATFVLACARGSQLSAGQPADQKGTLTSDSPEGSRQPNYYRALGATDQNRQRAEEVFVGKMMFDGAPYKVLTSNRARKRDLAGRKFFAMGWADFFEDDELYIIPLLAKYGFTSEFYAQIIPLTDNPFGSRYDIEKFRRIFTSGNYLGNHGIHHNVWIHIFPKFDGFHTPSNDDFRVARADGRNAFGHSLSTTLNDALRDVIMTSYLKNPALGAKTFGELTDSDCDYIRQKTSFFRSDADYQNRQDQLKCLDFLSNRYCGATGSSVKDSDYQTRTPNTADGQYPSPSNRVRGGVFQGAATLENQEVWERLEIIYVGYMAEVMGLDHPLRFWAIPGGITYSLFYRKLGAPQDAEGYADRACTIIANGFGRHRSSITGKERGYMDVLRSFGYKSSMGCLLGFGYQRADSQPRREGQFEYKLNSGVSKIDYVGDGYRDSLRIMDPQSGDLEYLKRLFASDDIMRRKYEETKGANSAYQTRNNYAQVVEEICKKVAQGMIPQSVEDSGISPRDGTHAPRRAHAALVYELIYQFCRKAGIEVISHTEATEVAFREIPKGVNIFPNAQFATTVKDVIRSDLAPSWPDGWDKGEVQIVGENRVARFTERSHVRSYLIQHGQAQLTADFRGKGTLNVYYVRNRHLAGGAEYESELAGSLKIDEADFQERSLAFAIGDAPLKHYTTEREDWRNYFQGWDDKICALHIEVAPDGPSPLEIKDPSLIVR